MNNKEYIRFSFLGLKVEIMTPSMKTIFILAVLLFFFLIILKT